MTYFGCMELLWSHWKEWRSWLIKCVVCSMDYRRVFSIAISLIRMTLFLLMKTIVPGLVYFWSFCDPLVGTYRLPNFLRFCLFLGYKVCLQGTFTFLPRAVWYVIFSYTHFDFLNVSAVASWSFTWFQFPLKTHYNKH